jgi:hypothetical protein
LVSITFQFLKRHHTSLVTATSKPKPTSSPPNHSPRKSAQPSPKITKHSPTKTASGSSLKNLDVGELKKYIKRMSIASNTKLELNDNLNGYLLQLVTSTVMSRGSRDG